MNVLKISSHYFVILNKFFLMNQTSHPFGHVLTMKNSHSKDFGLFDNLN
jgi:hypothetical protein